MGCEDNIEDREIQISEGGESEDSITDEEWAEIEALCAGFLLDDRLGQRLSTQIDRLQEVLKQMQMTLARVAQLAFLQEPLLTRE